MKKKGFTLIELLAVIIILAIISLIVTPMISNLIQNARKAAAKNSAQGYVDVVKNKISLSALDNQNIHGTHAVSELDSVLEYSGSRVEKGIVIVDGDILKEAKLCVNGYSFEYYSDQLKESNINYCIDKSNLEIAVLGTTINQELNNQYSYDLDLISYDISSATNVVCNNNAIPSVTNDTLHITDIYGDTKCSIESSIVTTFSNIDNTTTNVVMIKDETVSTTIDLVENKDAILYLNGHNITSTTLEDGQHTIRNSGILRIYGADSVINGTSGAIYNYANSELYVDGGTYNRIHTSSKKAVLKNLTVVCSTDASNCYPLWLNGTGDIEVDNLSVSTLGKALGVDTNQNPTVKITNSTFNCPNDNCIWLSGGDNMNVTIENSTIDAYGYGIANNGSGTVTINNLVINSGINNTAANIYSIRTGTTANGKININNSYLNSRGGGRGILLNAKTDLNISNSEIYGVKATLNVSVDSSNSNITITDSIISATNDHGIYLAGDSNLRIVNTQITGTSSAIANINNSSINITSGTFGITGAGYQGVIANRAAGIINICGATFNNSSSLPDLWNGSTGTIKYNNVTFTSGNTTPDSSEIYNSSTGTVNAVATCPITE